MRWTGCWRAGRWRAPRRAEPWTDTLDALAYASPCVQLASPLGGVSTAPPGTLVGSEDCLALNIWAPRFEATEVPTGADRLPVMLWIHGGANTIGLADEFYEGAFLPAVTIWWWLRSIIDSALSVGSPIPLFSARGPEGRAVILAPST